MTDLWDESGAISGSQCSTLESIDDSIVKWYTNWTWTGGSCIKSFSDIQLNTGINQQLSATTSTPSRWDWSQNSTGTVVADVAYDLFTSDTANSSDVKEVMIWLADSMRRLSLPIMAATAK